MDYLVVFDMWGQRCETIFDEASELDPLTWLRRMVDKGWLIPVEIIDRSTGIVLYTADNLKELTG